MNKRVKESLIGEGAIVTIVTVVATAGTATPVVATAWGQAFVIGSAGMATVYGVSETIEGYDLYRLGAAGDTITIAKNPVRDVVFQGNEELYRLWGEGSVLFMQLGLGGAGVVKLYNAGGLKAIAVEGGKIITSSVAGDMTSRFMADKLGMNETDAMLIGMLAGDVTYGGLNMLHGSLVERYRIESGKNRTTTIDYSYKFDRELANFNEGYEIRTSVDKELILVQYSSDASDASLCYWTTVDEANGITTLNDYMDKLALSKDWGNRNTVKVARIPAGTEVKYAVGTAREQLLIADPRPGGGVQYLFNQFDTNWITEIRSLSN